MPHANDGSQHQYRPRSAGILFIPDELAWSAPASAESNPFLDELIEAMRKPIAPPTTVPLIVRATPEQFARLWNRATTAIADVARRIP